MKRKKILCIGMSLVLSLCSFSLTAVHAEEVFPEGETLEKNGIEGLEKSVQEIKQKSSENKSMISLP